MKQIKGGPLYEMGLAEAGFYEGDVGLIAPPSPKGPLVEGGGVDRRS